MSLLKVFTIFILNHIAEVETNYESVNVSQCLTEPSNKEIDCNIEKKGWFERIRCGHMWTGRPNITQTQTNPTPPKFVSGLIPGWL